MFGYDFDVIKQEKGSSDCIACVAAMATGTTKEKFKSFFGKKGPYSDHQAYVYLLLHGYALGVGIGMSSVDVFNPKKYTARLELDFTGCAAFLGVESETRTDDKHAVYWNGKYVLDPNPLVTELRDWTSYKILVAYPINKIPGFNPEEPFILRIFEVFGGRHG